MSIESALEKLADAILVHAEALNSCVGGAYQEGGVVTNTASSGTGTKTETEEASSVDPKQEVMWANSDDGTYGKCTLAEYRKMAKKGGKQLDEAYSIIDPEAYKKRVAAAKKLQDDNKAAAEKAAKVKSDAAAKKKAEQDDEAGVITDEELGALVKPFAGVEDPKERKRRVEWLKDLFSRFGVPKASELKQEQRAEFCEIVKRATEAVEDDETADLPDLDDMESLV